MITGLIGFVAGVVLTGGAFIVFGQKNKKKIAEARSLLIEVYESASAPVKARIDKLADKAP